MVAQTGPDEGVCDGDARVLRALVGSAEIVLRIGREEKKDIAEHDQADQPPQLTDRQIRDTYLKVETGVAAIAAEEAARSAGGAVPGHVDDGAKGDPNTQASGRPGDGAAGGRSGAPGLGAKRS